MYSGWGLEASPKLSLPPFTVETFFRKVGAIFDWLGMSGTKHCKRCDRELPLSKFSKHKNSKDGLNFYCKDCMSEKGKVYRNKIKNTTSYIFSLIKNRKKFLKNEPFNISYAEFVMWYKNEQKICHYCDLPEEFLSKVNDVMNVKISRLSIDCMDNDKGYIKGNLVLACHRCNYTKNDAFTHEQMLYIGKNFLKPRWKKDIQKEIEE